MAPNQTSLLFLISPAEVRGIAATWQHEGAVVSGFDFTALSTVTGEGSRTIAALKGTEEPAKSATDAIGERLTTLGEKLQSFTVTTTENDKASADQFARLRAR